MKHKRVLFSLYIFLSSSMLLGQELRFMTYNIKYDNPKDTINNWNGRKKAMVRLVKHYHPHILGTQEALHQQITYLDSSLAQYRYIGVGRGNGLEKGEYSAIYYDTERLGILKSNTFWLSKTPNTISIGWDAALERICTYGLFEDKEDKSKFWVFNTHFDHKGKMAREKSAKLILRSIAEINTENLPVILMGDLNLTPEERPILHIKSILDDGLEISENPFYGPRGTFNGFKQQMVLDRRIDYIFTKGFRVLNYTHLDDRLENNKHISDHLPVLATGFLK